MDDRYKASWASAKRWTAGAAERARASSPGRRVEETAGAVARRTRAPEHTDGRPGSIMSGVWLVLGLLTIGTTFLNWVRIEVSDSLAALPLDERVPRGLLEVLDRGYSAHEVFGFGVILAVTTGIAIACGAAGFAARRWYGWLLAGIAQLVASAIAVVLLILAILAGSAIHWLVPDDWSPYEPQASLGSGGPAYLLSATVFGVLSWVIAVRSRRARGHLPAELATPADPAGPLDVPAPPPWAP